MCNPTSGGILTKHQVINYDIVSLVSDIGGTLGLFVGFSFFALWDFLKNLAVIVKQSFK